MAIRDMALAGLFAALLALSSQFSLPLGPVPHTLQIFFVVLAGLVLGSRLGATSVAVWVLLGVFGLPVFSQGNAGAAVLLGPTGGFLIGFIVCAYIVGWFTERVEVEYSRITAIMIGGLLIAYAIGLIGFMLSFAYFLGKPMTWYSAFTLSVVPFLPFDIIKVLMAAYVGVRVRRSLLRAGLAQK